MFQLLEFGGQLSAETSLRAAGGFFAVRRGCLAGRRFIRSGAAPLESFERGLALQQFGRRGGQVGCLAGQLIRAAVELLFRQPRLHGVGRMTARPLEFFQQRAFERVDQGLLGGQQFARTAPVVAKGAREFGAPLAAGVCQRPTFIHRGTTKMLGASPNRCGSHRQRWRAHETNRQGRRVRTPLKVLKEPIGYAPDRVKPVLPPRPGRNGTAECGARTAVPGMPQPTRRSQPYCRAPAGLSSERSAAARPGGSSLRKALQSGRRSRQRTGAGIADYRPAGGRLDIRRAAEQPRDLLQRGPVLPTGQVGDDRRGEFGPAEQRPDRRASRSRETCSPCSR